MKKQLPYEVLRDYCDLLERHNKILKLQNDEILEELKKQVYYYQPAIIAFSFLAGFGLGFMVS